MKILDRFAHWCIMIIAGFCAGVVALMTLFVEGGSAREKINEDYEREMRKYRGGKVK